ncbi:major histocompatibility complex class I-related gene protein-like [Corythoichthys intestinalis]|uniref:major histocompatibility complex class I-related gene protein-like n=1 Tax=Corythoichthys intestinalis TaxID=161448 RepID=UPI0025A4D2F6|nr:major histocompatibility complex class I-related gene protein-like [Corythoichthys intestinalis]XP_061808768.1 major histocompatibility complex class I-related gene protein-like [Nerophis lumbriciformis]
MVKLIFVLLFIKMTSPAEFSLSFYLSATEIPAKVSTTIVHSQFVGVVMLNNEVVGYYDSKNNKTAEPKQAWVRAFLNATPNHLEWYNTLCQRHHSDFNTDISNLKHRFNKSGGMHIIQRVSGCVFDNETDAVTGFNRYGFNGEDFILLDLEKKRWIATHPAAVTTKINWDKETATIEYMKYFYLVECRKLIKKYMAFGEEHLSKQAYPKMALLQKTPQLPVCCHASGFYPYYAANLFWRRNGIEVKKHVEREVIKPNHDRTFQRSVHLNVTAIPEHEWPEYECVFYFDEHLEDKLVTVLDKAVIRTNYLAPGLVPRGLVFGGLVTVLLFFVAGVSVVCWFWRIEDDNEEEK